MHQELASRGKRDTYEADGNSKSAREVPRERIMARSRELQKVSMTGGVSGLR